MSLTELHLRAARARVAAACAPPSIGYRLGTVRLRDDQCASAGRVAAALARYGGCLLADDVGRGKTYVALAVARGWTRPLVVLPASLRSTWIEAMRRAGVSYALFSHEALSRGRLPVAPYDGIIVDESHRFRSTSARRYAALATLSARVPLLLLSATPLQNRTRDLAAQVALFHGARAFQLDSGALAAFVVRGGSDACASLPVVAPPQWVHPAADDGAVLDAILALSPPARAADAGDAGVLRTIGLVRAWASSRAALREMLRRRRHVAAAIEQCATEGLVPTRRELRAWSGVDDAIQLGFAPLLVDGPAGAARVAHLLDTVAREHEGIVRLERAMAECDDPDDARVQVLRAIAAAHPTERVLAFTELASTARAFHGRLRDVAGVGLLTAREARIASGRLPRDALLRRFAPRASGAPAPVERERVTLLIATDLLSEGVNLQDASVVVHLDLPWNPARLAQRVGRIRRPGGASVVRSYLVAPPARAGLLLDTEHRLRTKLAEAAQTIGAGIDVVPRLTPPAETGDHQAHDAGRAAVLGALAELVARWARPTPARSDRRGRSLVAGVESPRVGWLAALDDGRLLASLDGAPPGSGDSASVAARACHGASRAPCPREVRRALAECAQWLEAESLARDCGQQFIRSELDIAIERRIARALRRTPRHERPEVARLAKHLRDALGSPRPLGAERELRALLDRPDARDDHAWLSDAAALACSAPARTRPTCPPRVVALITLGLRRSDW